MRDRRHSRLGVQSYASNSNVNITNITNITNVTRVSNFSVSGKSGRPHKIRHQNKERGLVPQARVPKLQRFCATCGVLDRDVASRMSEGELCAEAVNVIGHNAKGLARDVSDIGGGLCKAVGCVAGGLLGMFEAFVDAWD